MSTCPLLFALAVWKPPLSAVITFYEVSRGEQALLENCENAGVLAHHTKVINGCAVA